MKNLIVIVLCIGLFASCDMNKYTSVYIDNQNNFPIEVGIKTNNIETVYNVAANSTMDTLRKFTDIEYEDGEWEVTLTNGTTGKLIKKHNHGKYYQGDLSNSFSMKTKGNYIEFSVDI